MPELAEQLRMARMICRADQRDQHSAAGTSTRNSQLTVRCPHCQEVVWIDANVSWSNVTCGACGSLFGLLGRDAEDSDLQPGQFLGRFELVRNLGQGAFGAVWEAIDPQLDRTVALKIPRRGELTAAEAELFLREARAAAQIRHPHIVGIHEVGRVGDRIYLVCDFIQGETLADRLAREPFSLREVVALVETMARTLHHVHAQHVVHRDLKPANVLLDAQQQPYLTDFGLARRLAGDMTLTCDGQVVGTPAYMPPEQASGGAHKVDCRSDIYSLGVMLYELLTGELPFQGTPQAVVQQLLHDEPGSPRRLNPCVSRDLETICLKCLEKEPGRRYDTADALADDLRRLQLGEPITARPVGHVMRAVRWSRRKPFAAALIATFFLVTLAAFSAATTYRDLARREATARKSAEQSQRQRLEQLYVARMAAVQAAAEENDYQRASQLLQSLAPGTDDPDLRGFEWYYWRDKLRDGLLWELGPFERLEAVDFAPQTKWLAFGGHAGILRLKQLPDGKLVQQKFVDVDGRSVRIHSLAFSPDGMRLAVGTSGQQVSVLDVTTQTVVRDLRTAGVWIQDLEFSDDGKLLAAAMHDGGNVELWTDLKPETHRAIHVSEHTIRSLTISADNHLIAVIGGPSYGQDRGELSLIDSETGALIAQQKSEWTRGWGLAFSKDGQFLFNPYQSPGVDILAVDDLAKVDQVRYDGQSKMDPIALTRDGQLVVAGGTHGELVGWHVDSRQRFRTWPGHADQVMALAMDPDKQRMITCAYDGFVKCWDLRAPVETRVLSGLPYFNQQLNFSPNGDTVYIVGGDEEKSLISAFNVSSKQIQWESVEPRRMLGSACVSVDGSVLIVGMDRGEVRFIDAKTGKRMDSQSEHREEKLVHSCACSPDGQWLVTGEGPLGTPPVSGNRTEEVLLWDANAHCVVHRWLAHDRRVSLFLFAPGGKELFTYGWDKIIRHWRIPSGELLGEFPMGMKLATGLAFAEGSEVLAAVDTDGSIWRWNLADQRPLETIRSRKGKAFFVKWFASHQTILIPLGTQSNEDFSQRGSISFLDTRTWERKLNLDVCPGAVSNVAISPHGETLVAGDSAGNLYCWQVSRDDS